MAELGRCMWHFVDNRAVQEIWLEADDMHDLTMSGRLAACHDAWLEKRHEAKVKWSPQYVAHNSMVSRRTLHRVD